MTKWQCRKCGPVPQANPQPAARIKKTARKWVLYCDYEKRLSDVWEKGIL